MKVINGTGVSNGIAIGKIHFFNSTLENIPDYKVEDTKAEIQRYRMSMDSAKKFLTNIYESACQKVSKEEAVIFKTHILVAEDSKLVKLVEADIINNHRNAEAAVYDAYNDLAYVFKNLEDEYFKARYNDILDVANILINILQNKYELRTEIGEDAPVIVAAKDLFPSYTISFERSKLLGLMTNESSYNSHTAILARTMGIPSVIQIDEPLEQYDNATAVIDGQLGKIIIEPDTNTLALYEAKSERYKKQQQRLKNQIGRPSQTKNKQSVRLSADIRSLEEISNALNNDADGIGIFRSEALFTNRGKAPDEGEQIQTYKTLLKAFGDKGVAICTVNGSSEMSMDYLDIPREKNPALGFRGIRISLENSDFFRTQLRALYRASVYGKLSILLPMVSSIEEIDYVKREIDDIQNELRLQGEKFSNDIKLGLMIETPAAAILSDELSSGVDFVNIATDNLAQYTLAMDKENKKLVDFYRPYHPAVKKLTKIVIDNAHKNGKPVALSGHYVADTAITKVLLALKADEFVVTPSDILRVKAAVRETDTSDPEEILKNNF